MRIYYYCFIFNFLNIVRNEALFFLLREKGLSKLFNKLFSLINLSFNYYFYFNLNISLFKLLGSYKTQTFSYKSLVLLFIDASLLRSFNRFFFINKFDKRNNLFLFENYKLNMTLKMFFLVREHILNIRFFTYMEFIRYNIANLKIREAFLKNFQSIRKN